MGVLVEAVNTEWGSEMSIGREGRVKVTALVLHRMPDAQEGKEDKKGG